MTVSGQTPAEAGWLQEYLTGAVGSNLCTRIHCTTCGAMEFRQGLLSKLARLTGRQGLKRLDHRSAVDIARSLALVQPVGVDRYSFEEAARLVLFDIWYAAEEGARERDLELVLAGTWAGSVLERMKAHHQARSEERRAYAESQDPVRVRQKREEKRRLRQEKHSERLALKKERDRTWRAKHEKGGT